MSKAARTDASNLDWSVAMRAWIKRHPVTSYFTLAFGISWGGVLLAIGSSGIPGAPEEFDARFPVVYLAMLAGPSVAGVLMTLLLGGRAGLSDFGARLTRWRVEGRWYAAALVVGPLLMGGSALLLSLISPRFLPAVLASPDPLRTFGFGIVVGLGAGFFEELGWTGFAVPAMRRRAGVLVTGLVVGVLWGAWHFLASLWGGASAVGGLSLSLVLTVELFSFLPPYRVLMVRVYERTGSLLVAMLMHASLTSSMLILGPQVSGTDLVAHNLLLGGVLWALVAASARLAQRSPDQPARLAVAR
jgi:uncharacterized protein